MVKLEESKRRLCDYCYELALREISHMTGILNIPLKCLESMMTEAEMADDARYGALCKLYETLKETIETLTNNTGI